MINCNLRILFFLFFSFVFSNVYAFEKCSDFFNKNISYYELNANEFSKVSSNNTEDNHYYKSFIQLILNNRAQKSQLKILDAGTGSGKFAQLWDQETFIHITGIDRSDNMLKIAKTNNPGMNLINMNIKNLKFEDEYFDAISTMYSLIHLDIIEVRQSLSEMFRVLKRKGIIFVAVQGGRSLEKVNVEGLNQSDLSVLTLPNHVLSKELTDAGFESVSEYSIWNRPPAKSELNFHKTYALFRKP